MASQMTPAKVENNGVEISASITDLPLLVEKYESCVSLPGIKIFELNELAAIAPAQLRSELFRLAYLFGEIGSQSPEGISSQMKEYIDIVNRKIAALERVDTVLQTVEKSALPLLFEHRFFKCDTIHCVIKSCFYFSLFTFD